MERRLSIDFVGRLRPTPREGDIRIQELQNQRLLIFEVAFS